MERIKILRRLKPFINVRQMIKVLICLSICIVLSVIYPFIYKFFIDKVLLEQKIYNLQYVVLFICIWLACDITVKNILGKSRAVFITQIILKIKETLFNNILNYSLQEYINTSPNEYKMVIEDDSKEIESFFLVDIFNYIVCILTIVLLLIIMFFLNPILLLSCMIFFVVSYFETKLIKKRVIRNAEELRNSLSEEDHIRTDELYNYREIKTLSCEKRIVEKFENRSKYLVDLITKEKIYQYMNKYLGALNHDLITRFFIYIVGGILVVSGTLSTSSFLIFLGFYEIFVKNVRQIIESNFSYNNKKSKLEKIVQYLNIEENYVIDKDNQTEPCNCKEIQLENIWFKYNQREKWILKDFNIRFKSGKIYLLQGRSGEGKSTLLKLLYKELTNYEGNIWIDNIEYRQIKGNTDFFKLFGIASSDSKLFNSTIAENLLFAKPNATENELINSCKMALLYDDIMKMKDGFNTKIGENGNQLSGGQRERLVIARIFLKENVKVYILDEALAEISITNETQILNNLKDVNKNSIIIIVSHRLLNWEYAENVRI